MRSQIVTHLTRGFIVFDIAKGILTNRETRWDERIIGYKGPESYMHYIAFRKEVLVQEQQLVSTKPLARAGKQDPIKEPEQQTQAKLLQPMKK